MFLFLLIFSSIYGMENTASNYASQVLLLIMHLKFETLSQKKKKKKGFDLVVLVKRLVALLRELQLFFACFASFFASL